MEAQLPGNASIALRNEQKVKFPDIIFDVCGLNLGFPLRVLFIVNFEKYPPDKKNKWCV